MSSSPMTRTTAAVPVCVTSISKPGSTGQPSQVDEDQRAASDDRAFCWGAHTQHPRRGKRPEQPRDDPKLVGIPSGRGIPGLELAQNHVEQDREDDRSQERDHDHAETADGTHELDPERAPASDR